MLKSQEAALSNTLACIKKGIIRVKCRVVDGKDKGKILTRNVIGPLKLGDYIRLRETEIESAGGSRRR